MRNKPIISTIMKRLARVNGNVVAVITGDEQVNCKRIDEKLQYPVKFFGENDYVPVIIQNGIHFNVTVGQTTENLEDWKV